MRPAHRAGGVSSAISTLIAALGGNSVVAAAYDDAVNVGTTAGKVDTWDDARGSSGFGPTLVGNNGGGANKPSYAAGVGITTDGVNYVAALAAAARLDVMGAEFWIATISTYGSVGGQFGFQSIISDSAPTAGSTRYLTVTTANKASILLTYQFGNMPQAGEGPVPKSSNLRLTVGTQSSFQSLFSEQFPRVGFEVAGRCKQQINSSFLGAGSNFLSYGYGLTQKQGDTVRAIIICSGVYTRAQALALKTYATSKGIVVEATKPKQLITTGDSLTFGFASTSPPVNSWPAQLMSRNAAAMASYEMYNHGVSGRRASGIKLINPIDIHPTLGTYHTKDLVVYWAGINDVEGTADSAATVIANIKVELSALKAIGASVFMIPMIPAGDANIDAAHKIILQTIQDDAKNNGSAYNIDGIVPVWNDSRFNDFTLVTGSFSNATYYNADKLHLTDAGYTAIADLVFPVISPFL